MFSRKSKTQQFPQLLPGPTILSAASTGGPATQTLITVSEPCWIDSRSPAAGALLGQTASGLLVSITQQSPTAFVCTFDNDVNAGEIIVALKALNFLRSVRNGAPCQPGRIEKDAG